MGNGRVTEASGQATSSTISVPGQRFYTQEGIYIMLFKILSGILMFGKIFYHSFQVIIHMEMIF